VTGGEHTPWRLVEQGAVCTGECLYSIGTSSGTGQDSTAGCLSMCVWRL